MTFTCSTCDEPMNYNGQDECKHCFYARMLEERQNGDAARLPKEFYEYYFNDAAHMASRNLRKGLEQGYTYLQWAIKDHGIVWASARHFYHFEEALMSDGHD